MTEFIHKGEQKKRFVQDMFDEISGTYDFLNHFLSFGVDIHWRRVLKKTLAMHSGQTLLDVATGTGDVAIAIAKEGVTVLGLDYSLNMLKVARKKTKDKYANILFLQGDGEQLPLPNESVDALSIAFGFRNIGHQDRALAEFYRVLKPGGKLAILEFSKPKSRVFAGLYQFYFQKILPRVAAGISQNYAYRYLPESVQAFPLRTEVLENMRETGFQKTHCRDLTFGICSIFSAEK